MVQREQRVHREQWESKEGNNSRSVPELLAPAGGVAAWAAALEAGAGAIYAGPDHFSARTLAENFTISELRGLVEESHRVGVRVYLAFNSLIKEDELPQAFRQLMQIADLGPDAFIIQDLGLAELARRYCGHIERHASTLLAVHSLPGLNVLKDLGFSRAVLPREMTLREVGVLSAYSPVPLEIFIHGALCFSFSGLCLMSSFLGGRSSLRGGCTQPCRRAYLNGGRRRTFFSPPDFQAAAHMAELKKLPLAAFKIEGRMKGADYVGRVVRAYRLLIDASEASWDGALAEAMEILSQAPGRPAGAGFLTMGRTQPVFQGEVTSGLKVGYLYPVDGQTGKVTTELPLKLGDRLRLVGGAGEEGLAFKLKKMWLDGQEVDEVSTGAEVLLGLESSTKGLLFKTGSGREDKMALASAPVKRLRQIAEGFRPAQVPNLPREPGRTRSLSRVPLWYWLDETRDLEALMALKPSKIIMVLTPANAREMGRLKKRLRPFPELVWSLEPLIFHQRQEKIRQEASRLVGAGARDFLVSNLGHINLLNRLAPGLRLWSDHRLGILNHYAAQTLMTQGLKGVTVSPEIDSVAYTALVNSRLDGGLLLYLYGRPALFTSRFNPPGLKRGAVVSPRGEKFRVAEEGDALIVQAEKSVFMGQFLKQPTSLAVAGLLVDLRREPRPAEAARLVKKAVLEGRGTPGVGFNFKRGLV